MLCADAVPTWKKKRNISGSSTRKVLLVKSEFFPVSYMIPLQG